MVFLILLLSSRISLATAFRKTRDSKATLRGGELKAIYSSLELALCKVYGQYGLSGDNLPASDRINPQLPMLLSPSD